MMLEGPNIKLIRTDTILDLSQKAEKVLYGERIKWSCLEFSHFGVDGAKEVKDAIDIDHALKRLLHKAKRRLNISLPGTPGELKVNNRDLNFKSDCQRCEDSP
ncbi:hypothetical protein VNO80_09843 [Phaseolus coccineus]|uniref:Uncharacterized protein n=1 Tax=Phaseolus coccineus TaxID=3886 RepID=A0AAN9N796_PHACN